jgi:NADH dehydrogenase
MSAEGSKRIVIAGAGYAGLRIVLRLAARLDDRQRDIELTLVDKYDYHQILTELPRVAGGARAAEEVRIPLHEVVDRRVAFVQTAITGFDLPGRRLITEAGEIDYWRLALALGSRPNDFGIPGLAERALTLYSVEDARRVLAAVDASVAAAVSARTPEEQRRCLTVVIGGGGATGVELAGELAEELPELARRHDLSPEQCRVILIDAGPTILAGSSPGLVARAMQTLSDLGVEVRTNQQIARATEEGFVLKSGEVISGGVFVWAGGVKAVDVVAGSGFSVGHNGRIKVDDCLRALDWPEVYVAGDLASVPDLATGRALPPTAQNALEQGETVADNLLAEIAGRDPQPYAHQDRGFVVSVGGRRGAGDVLGRTVGGRVAHLLKDAIEWEYRQSVKHLRGWSPI